MSGAALVIATWIFLGLELGLKDALSLGHEHIAPSFMFCFLTFLAMFSSHPRPLRDGTGTATLIGPYALSYLLSVQLITALRGLVIKRNPLTVGFLSFMGSIVCQVVLVGILSIRMWWGDAIFGPEASPSQELLARLASAAYTGLLGCGLGLILFPLAPWLGLAGQTRKR
jgi:hypothetical protein